jgi:hypothetical protein
MIGSILGEFSPIVQFFYVGQFSEKYRSRPPFEATFSTEKVACNFLQKMGWAAFWASFSQTPLVTLIGSQPP